MSEVFSWLLPLFIASILIGAINKKVPAYDAFVDGAQDGWQMILKVLPNLVGMFMAIAVWRESGMLDYLSGLLAPVFVPLGVPKALLPLAVIKPLSGSGATAALIEVTRAYGPDSYEAIVAAVMAGSSETIIYVLGVYAGAARIRNTRYILPCMILCWLVGIFASVYACELILSGMDFA